MLLSFMPHLLTLLPLLFSTTNNNNKTSTSPNNQTRDNTRIRNKQRVVQVNSPCHALSDRVKCQLLLFLKHYRGVQAYRNHCDTPCTETRNSGEDMIAGKREGGAGAERELKREGEKDGVW